MPRELIFHPAASEEAVAAWNWYAERSALAADAFVHEIDLSVDRLMEGPHRFPAYIGGTRRLVFPRFPFTLIFRYDDERIEVVAIAHQRRRPGYWRNRQVEPD